MLAVFSKSLCNGTVNIAAADPEWETLKVMLTSVDYFAEEEWDSVNYAYENLRNGNVIVTSTSMWKLIDMFRIKQDGDTQIFEGNIVYLSEIDPVFN